MTFEPANGEMTQVHFSDEDHAYEGPPGMGNDSDALIEQLDGMDDYHLNSRKKSYSMVKVCCVLIPVMAAMGAGFYFLFKPDSTSSGGGTSALMAPPANLEARCATASPECKQACEPAECCDFPANLQLSCLSGNEDQCLKYHTFCGVLKGGDIPTAPAESIPPPPSNLKDLCTVESIRTVDGFAECQEACQPAECCVSNENTCHDASCHAYSPCLVMSTSSKVQPDVISPHIKEQCSDVETALGRTSCRLACSHALCCFLKDNGSSSSCPHPNDAFCDQYTICNQLEANVNIKSTPTEMKQVCDAGHTSLCEVVCERGACCFAEEGCPSEDVQCDDYLDICSVIYEDEREDGGAGENTSSGGDDTSGSGGDDTSGGDTSSGGGDDNGVDTTNGDTDDGGDTAGGGDSTNGGDTTGGGGDTTGGGDATTPDDGGDDSDDHTGNLVFKADVDDACMGYDPASVSEGQSECHKLCQNVGCCFLESGCGAVAVNCHTYKECGVIYGVEDDDSDDDGDDDTLSGGGDDSISVGGNTSGGGDASGGGASTGDTLADACDSHSADKVNVPDQVTQCETMCAKYKCCFEVNDCPEPKDQDCSKGDGCKALWGDGSPPAFGEGDGSGDGTSGGDKTIGDGTTSGSGGTSVTLTDACDTHAADKINVPDQVTPCETMCSKYKCCFAVNDCPAPKDQDCSEGDACIALWGDGGPPPAFGEGGDSSLGGGDSTGGTSDSTGDSTSAGGSSSDSAITEACKGESALPSICQQLCGKYECCFSVNYCDVPAGTDCSAGSDCDTLWTSGPLSGDSDGQPPDGGGPDDGVGEGLVGDGDNDEPSVEDPIPPDLSLYDTLLAACEEGVDMEKCENLCTRGRCCFESQGCADEVSDDVECNDYDGCLVVYAVDGEEESGGGDAGDGGAGDDGEANPDSFSRADVDAACSGDAVSSMCTVLCDPSECCFRSSMTCGQEVDCNKYGSCTKVWERRLLRAAAPVINMSQ